MNNPRIFGEMSRCGINTILKPKAKIMDEPIKYLSKFAKDKPYIVDNNIDNQNSIAMYKENLLSFFRITSAKNAKKRSNTGNNKQAILFDCVIFDTTFLGMI